ncbi:glycoside hydrolase family 18 protein [Hyaloscypha variabilis F]|uniref:Glycoside hydrolase family 18 protein n=1 Tax=Hyaloscypha variabilis (strain UAMH 11265 / GT02V1 / F) TaxID=1149755 RepID=A0A2J6S2C0_HYAVF|nr:glycoside hydrolase family 18 protein [Hyaloscypha variabilis F]
MLDLLQSTLDLVQGIAVANGLSSASAATSPSPSPSPPPVVNEIFTPIKHPNPQCTPSTSTIISTLTSTTTATPTPVTTTETVTVSAAALPIQPTTTLAQIPDALTSAAQSGQQAAATSTLPAITPISSAAAIYEFNATSSTNIAVYFGQTAATGATSLLAQCADPNIDIVILAFVLQQLDGGAYPQLNFGAACGGQTPTMAAKAPGLLYCPDLAGNITACQRGYGKKVLLSIGGASSNIKFTNAAQAKKFAGVLWDLFGPPGSIDPTLRPFGTVEVDGFDIDNEDNFPANFPTLASSFRALFPLSLTKQYYLSSAPQCLFPFADPLPMLLQCDFVWVQFFNNPACQIGTPGFNNSLVSWAKNLNASTLTPKPRFFVGAPSWSGAAPLAYEGIIGGPEGMQKVVRGVREVMGKNGVGSFLGGVMFWDVSFLAFLSLLGGFWGWNIGRLMVNQ